MTTPIFDFVKAYSEGKTARFHMPGHKGVARLGCEKYDITEISGADVLYSARGIIEESEKNLTSLYGTAHSFYSTEGSTLAIKAMLALISEREGGDRPLILAARNVHTAFIKACALLDLDAEFIYPEREGHLCECRITAEDVKRAIVKAEKKPRAVYLTSPDYLGNMLDISAISAVCREYGLPLLVDNAHGAYLNFLSPSIHPIALGADMCCDSAHKTLPVLTGGAYLHISPAADEKYVLGARNALSVFASTSPSYLILQSLDLCNKYLAEGYENRLSECVKRVEETRAFISQKGFAVMPSEPLKITLNASASGYTGKELAVKLRTYNIECEFADDSYLVLMISPETRDIDFDRLEQAFSELPVRSPLTSENDTFCLDSCEQCMTIREAIFGESETVSVENAVGRICGAPTVSCPPAIPIVVSGERISENAVKLFKRYGIEEISVVK